MSPKTTTLNQTTRRGATVHVDGRSAAIRLFAICLSIEVVFVLLDYFVNYRRFSSSTTLLRLTTITREDALATWFSSTQTLFVGLTAWLFWLGTRRTNAARWRQAGWCLVALFFTYVAIDDAMQLHERLTAAARVLFNLRSFPTYLWHLVFVPPLATAALLSVFFLGYELDRRQFRLLLAGFGLFALAVALDFVEGLDPNNPWNVYANAVREASAPGRTPALNQQQFDTVLYFSGLLEEFSEMLGTTVIWTSFLTHTRTLPDISFRSRSTAADS